MHVTLMGMCSDLLIHFFNTEDTSLRFPGTFSKLVTSPASILVSAAF